MDAFEQLVSEILWMEGYWVRASVKVELTKEEKRLIGRHSFPQKWSLDIVAYHGRHFSPPWELDIVAYHGRNNLLRVVECKSFFDSAGVKACCFDGTSPTDATRYKLFNEPELRRVVFNRLCLQLAEAGACREAPEVRLSLACGKVRNEINRTAIRAHFAAQGWDLWDEPWLRERLQRMAQQGYEKQVPAVLVKQLLRSNAAEV